MSMLVPKAMLCITWFTSFPRRGSQMKWKVPLFTIYKTISTSVKRVMSQQLISAISRSGDQIGNLSSSHDPKPRNFDGWQGIPWDLTGWKKLVNLEGFSLSRALSRTIHAAEASKRRLWLHDPAVISHRCWSTEDQCLCTLCGGLGR